jgi:hypothetical protein
MPSADQIQQYLTGAWRMMTGRPDGLDMLDLSVDGFWNSFFAIVIAFPALVVGWVSAANGLGGESLGGRVSVLVRLGMIDMLTWIVPIALLAAVARPFGIAHRFVPYVVATNWASALFIWIMLPPAVVNLFWPSIEQATSLVSLLIFLATLVLAWRVTNAALGMGATVASGVFAGMFGVSLALLLMLQPLFGLSPAP